MELKPVVRIGEPNYPDRYAVELDKTLLENRPKAWLAKPIIGLALSAIMAAGLTGFTVDCNNPFGSTGGEKNTQTEEPDNNGNGSNTGGDGQTEEDMNNRDDWGIIGGGMPAPISYLADKDALIIIADELSKAGMEYVPHSTISSVKFDGSVRLDESGKSLPLEYVSMDDCDTQKYPLAIYPDYAEPQEIAKNLTELYQGHPAIFYDPLSLEPYNEEHLRAQVLDFIEWLTAIGNE